MPGVVAPEETSKFKYDFANTWRIFVEELLLAKEFEARLKANEYLAERFFSQEEKEEFELVD